MTTTNIQTAAETVASLAQAHPWAFVLGVALLIGSLAAFVVWATRCAGDDAAMYAAGYADALMGKGGAL